MANTHDTDPPPPDSRPPSLAALEPPLPGVLGHQLDALLTPFGGVPSEKRTVGEVSLAERQARAMKLIAEARDLLLGF